MSKESDKISQTDHIWQNIFPLFNSAVFTLKRGLLENSYENRTAKKNQSTFRVCYWHQWML